MARRRSRPVWIAALAALALILVGWQFDWPWLSQPRKPVEGDPGARGATVDPLADSRVTSNTPELVQPSTEFGAETGAAAAEPDPGNAAGEAPAGEAPAGEVAEDPGAESAPSRAETPEGASTHGHPPGAGDGAPANGARGAGTEESGAGGSESQVSTAPIEDPATLDRLAGCTANIEAWTAEGDFAAAARVWVDAERLELRTERARATLEKATSALTDRVAAETRAALAGAAAGEVLRASTRLRPVVLARHHPKIAAVVDTVATAFGGVPASGLRATVSEASRTACAAPAKLPADTAVRWRDGDEWLTGRVVSSRQGRVSLHVRQGRRVFYPVVARHQVEPTAADSALALDQAAAGIRAGDGLLAALWLVRAAALTEQAGPPATGVPETSAVRAMALAELLAR